MNKKRCPRFSWLVLLDLRAWVAAMFFVFGMMLAGYGVFFADAEDLAKAKGTNLDLWTGVGMIVFAVSFAVWLLARPPEFEIVPDAESLAGAAEGEANEAEATISLALSTAPLMPSAGSVRTSSAPNARKRARRSFDIDEGMVKITLYPRAAPTQASPIPVLPDVPSTIVPPSGS